MAKRKIYTISNLLSFLRLLLALPMIVLLYNGLNYYALALGFFAVITDLADGWFARRNNEITDLGKIIDPLADKVFLGGTIITLFLLGRLPLWFLITALSRDIIILAAGLYLKNKIKIVVMSNYVGKITVIIISVTLAFAILDFPEPLKWGMIASTGGIIISSYFYTLNFLRTLKNKEA